MNGVIVGLQYGDEGKGRVSAYFLEKDQYDWNIRFSGGNNAGHTVYSGGEKYALHHLPAGSVLNKKVALDAGMVIDPFILMDELNRLNHRVDLYISENVNLITQEHIRRDSDGSGVGSTKRGIAYVYADRALRRGKRVKDVESILNNIPYTVYSGPAPILPHENALFEGAQGIMLDVDYGHYPYVTSSSVFPRITYDITERIGVMKAYTSRVGDGPPDVDLVPELTKLGAEYGTTTGRPRKCTWLLIDELKYAISLLRPTKIVVTKLDILKDQTIYVWDNGRLIKIGDLDTYKQFLIETFPQITHFSEAPDGDMCVI